MGFNPPEQKASVVLPPEILDDILKHIPAYGQGKLTLVASALVATWWTGPSQRRLFSSITIHDDNYSQWMDCVVRSESKTRLLGYVHSLVHILGLKKEPRYPMQNLPPDSGEYLSALHNLHSLSLHHITFKNFGEEGFHTCFSGFRETLTKLTLEGVAASFTMFVTLVSYFPNISILRPGSFKLKPDEGPVPSLPRPFRGKLYITPGCGKLINRLAGLDLEYDGLVIQTFSVVEAEVLQNILQLSAGTIRYLRLDAILEDHTVTIGHLGQLRELDLYVNWSSTVHEGIISSITSTKFHKITFPVNPNHEWNILSQGTELWDSIDKELCELVARIGYSHKLEVELRPTNIGYDLHKYDLTHFLTEFRKKGILTVRDDNPDWNP